MNNEVFGKACNSRRKKKSFSVRTKLSYNKLFPEDLLAIEMEKEHKYS